MDHYAEWLGKPFQPFDCKDCSDGFRIYILDTKNLENDKTHYLHWSGGDLLEPVKEVLCPSCNTPFFPVFKLDFSDERLKKLELWDGPSLQVLICLRCVFYLRPYWTFFERGHVEVVGGYYADPILKSVRLPYPTRPIEMVKLSDRDYPLTDSAIDEFICRKRPPGVYHQVGGLPILGRYKEMECIKCRMRMVFAGIVDNDDSNVYLYEAEGNETTLVIGDSDRLYFYTCKACLGIGIKCVR